MEENCIIMNNLLLCCRPPQTVTCTIQVPKDCIQHLWSGRQPAIEEMPTDFLQNPPDHAAEDDRQSKKRVRISDVVDTSSMPARHARTDDTDISSLTIPSSSTICNIESDDDDHFPLSQNTPRPITKERNTAHDMAGAGSALSIAQEPTHQKTAQFPATPSSSPVFNIERDDGDDDDDDIPSSQKALEISKERNTAYHMPASGSACYQASANPLVFKPLPAHVQEKIKNYGHNKPMPANAILPREHSKWFYAYIARSPKINITGTTIKKCIKDAERDGVLPHNFEDHPKVKSTYGFVANKLKNAKKAVKKDLHEGMARSRATSPL